MTTHQHHGQFNTCVDSVCRQFVCLGEFNYMIITAIIVFTCRVDVCCFFGMVMCRAFMMVMMGTGRKNGLFFMMASGVESHIHTKRTGKSYQ